MRQTEKTENARAVALAALIQILEEGGFSHIVLRTALREHPALSARDRAFVTRLVEGTLEYELQLDAVLNLYSKTKTEKMKPLIRNVLRMSVYQLLYLDRVPDSAVINEAVQLVKRHKFMGLSGFVNGVLRSIAREKETLLAVLSDPEKTAVHVRYSVPEWLYDYLCRQYGEAETARMCGWFLAAEKETYVRYRDGSSGTVQGNVAESEAFLEGELSVQDYASQQVGLLAAPEPGAYVVDVCAAPGGKCCHVAELLSGSGCVDARDLTEQKCAMIQENIERLKLKNIRAKVWDARKTDPSLLTQTALRAADGSRQLKTRGKADIVIADLPCSGLGIIGKKPDIKRAVKPEQIQSLQSLQREILQTVHQYVKPGGRLLYSTCTLTAEENEQNRDWILANLPFVLRRERKFLPGQPSDGFYIAEFERETGEAQ